MTTRRAVAEAAGVSLRTVSNVVNGHRYVADDTRARVLRAIDELGYRPSELARNLKRGRSGLLGLVLPDLDTPYFAELTRAFVEEGDRRGVTVVIDQTDGDLARERRLIDRLGPGAVFDGLIVGALALRDEDLTAVGPDRPLVFLGEHVLAGRDHVMIDNRLAARQAVEHLVATGRRRIAAIGAIGRPGEPAGPGASSLRLDGYRDGLEASGRVVDDGLVEHVPGFRRADGAAAMARLLDRSDPPDAVFCFSDPLALGALRTLLTRGVSVPEDVALVGFDDVEDGRFSTPSLTSISPDKSAIARAALDLAIDRIDRGAAGAPPADAGTVVIAPHRLVVRESSSTAVTGQAARGNSPHPVPF
ncbi:LacI family DNA-binding transcriptional regulator [Curtobacterium sp. RRHDQ10]|uniref:LacI family DNA-binding transcriptional regulator n=1 Tax=Curtobacterium phyllosphaerae TaxID=3413379 RepID=UPI003BEFF959